MTESSDTASARPMTYDTLSFLLDRANIEDVIRKIGMYVDEGNYDGLVSDVFADEVFVDYSLIFNKPAGKISARAQSDEWKMLVQQLDASQHAIGNLIVDLPQPGSGEAPATASVVGQYSVTLCRDTAPGEKYTWNVGRYHYKVVRTGKDGNPWRLSFIKPTPVRLVGAQNIYEGDLQLKQ